MLLMKSSIFALVYYSNVLMYKAVDFCFMTKQKFGVRRALAARNNHTTRKGSPGQG